MVVCPNYAIIFHKRLVFQYISPCFTHLSYTAPQHGHLLKKPILTESSFCKKKKKCLRIITFSFYKDLSNPLFKNLKLLKLRDVLESETIKFFYKLSRNELLKSVFSIFNLVHEVHTRNTRNNLLIYIPRMYTSRCGNHSLRSDGASLWNKFFKDFFPSHDLTSFFKLKSFLMKRFLQTYENEL